MKTKILQTASFLALGLVALGGIPSAKADQEFAYPTVDPSMGEVMQPGEAESAKAIGDAIEMGLSRRAKVREQGSEFERERPFIRDAHPKAHGCVKANFRVMDDIPDDLAQGIFAQSNKNYCSWVGFSNSNEDPRQSDAKPDGRGMAIKLLDVEGRSLLADYGISGTQDFIMISHPVFFINDAKDYATVVQQQNQEAGPSLFKLFSAIGLQGSLIASDITSLKNRNPFEGEYWSMVPYQLGQGEARQKIKFKSQPCGYSKLSKQDQKFFRDPEIPEDANPNFLRKAMASALNSGSPCMEFLVQKGTASMSVEDAKTEWSPKAAPFIKVAELKFLPGQNFNTDAQNLACEDMSYNPWHGLTDHKPLGALNRIRKVVYQRISTFRHDNNMAPLHEPPMFDQYQCQNGHWKQNGQDW